MFAAACVSSAADLAHRPVASEYPEDVVGPHFRAGVILVVRRGDGTVMAFERSDVPGAWQLPQGGLDDGESPEAAGWRELAEETGLGPESVRLTDAPPSWTVYELPAEQQRPGRLGQAHRWLFFDVLDDHVEPTPDGVEFSAWAWMTPAALIDVVAAFRRPGYEEMLGGIR
ncbi:MAG: NUDIX domain-containing protein [Actinobacteria bacterium]|jgi:putative (di)nucleoside polyphosphate hydrolase|nr:NUDIX domain-containing protein [Actinomycetota bacterium]